MTMCGRHLAVIALAACLAGCASSLADPDRSAGPAAERAEGPSDRSALATPALSTGATRSGHAEERPGAQAPTGTAYRIGPQDMVEIHVFKVPELSKHYQVSDAGLINFPLLGTVAAAGKTTGELEQHLASQLGTKFLQSPQVNVTLKEYNSQRITLEGAGIRKSGVYPLTGPTTLLQLIAMSGGLSETSDSQLAIHRQAGGRPEVLQFDIDSLRSGRTKDPLLSAGDVVFASSSTTKEVFNGLIRAAPLASAVLRPY